jgi:hypothetical protein
VEAACRWRTPRERPKLVQPVTGPCSRAFGNDCSITENLWILTRAREFALSWPRPNRGGVGSRELRYESPRRVGRINQPESMDPRACSRKPFLADSPRFIGWRSLDRSYPTSNALCRCARTARTTPNRASSSGAAPAVAEATRHRSFDGLTQSRSRALGLEVNELLLRAFRRLAETLKKFRIGACSSGG